MLDTQKIIDEIDAGIKKETDIRRNVEALLHIHSHCKKLATKMISDWFNRKVTLED